MNLITKYKCLVMNHPNIIRICTKPKLAIVIEYASKGSLFDLLYKN